MTKLSLITINYNGLKDTLDLLESIYSTVSSVSFEVIVVDNCSSDRKEPDIISSRFPQALIVRSDSNRGFAGGNNLGIAIASGEFIMLINNDTLVMEDHFDILLRRFAGDPSIGGVSPKIVFAEPQHTIQFAGYTPLSVITMRNSLIGFSEPDDGRYAKAHPTPYCHGAAMIVSRKALEKSGRMTEKYFLYYEELDWSVRIARSGFSLWYDPVQTIIHKESATIGASSATKAYYMARNRLLFAYRNIDGINKYLSIIYQLFISIPKGVFVYLLSGKFANSIAAIKGTLDFFGIKNKKL